ncbi:MAG: low specificity L-threonine aldolase [Sneathiella sp.]|nr:low specificity L-threonine aldolase [Sneathiella sp.]
MFEDQELINFASDNVAPVCPEIIEALRIENTGPAMGYGNDDTTREMETELSSLFECDLRAFPVATGTAANVLSLSVMTPPYGSIYCHKMAHIEGDECGAPEFYTGGAKLALLDGPDGKISADILEDALAKSGAGNVHHIQPSAISIAQVTECGTIYTPAEIAAISAVARKYNIGFHMDGARFANSVAALNCSPADITWKAGVDLLSFGATKNGAMAAEAVVFFNMEKAAEFEFRRKRGAHLFSKSRYLSAQINAYLEDGLWLELAGQANNMSQRMANGLSDILNTTPHYKVDANIIFTTLPERMIDALEKAGFLFYVMGSREVGHVRLVTSWNTTEEEVDSFLDVLKRNL